eukprot:2443847-Prymnesium_polylepis.1
MAMVVGPCVLTGRCIQSSSYPTGNYGHSESCTVSGLPATTVQVVHFDVEESSDCEFDYLRIGGVSFCGTSGCLLYTSDAADDM